MKVLTARHTLCRAAMLAGVLLLSACSMPRLVYEQADWLLLRQVDGYLDLDDVQSERLAGEIAAWLARHRVEQLPEIAGTLRDAAQRAKRGIVPQDASWATGRARDLLVRGVEGLIPPLAGVLAELSPQQRAHLAARIARRNEEYRDTHALDEPQQVRFERRARRAVDRIEDWTGPLTPEQVQLVHDIRNAMPDSAPDWLTYTESRQRALLALIDERAPAPRIEALLRGWWLRLDVLPPSLAANRDRQIEALHELMVRLDATLNSTQRAHLVDRIEDLARDALALAART